MGKMGQITRVVHGRALALYAELEFERGRAVRSDAPRDVIEALTAIIESLRADIQEGEEAPERPHLWALLERAEDALARSRTWFERNNKS
jgi:hypothetical protein